MSLDRLEEIIVANVLVVEDAVDIRKIIMTILNRAGVKTTGVEDALLALQQLKEKQFDLITLDLNLPGMDGNEFLVELAKIAPDMPVIVISANTELLLPHPQVKAVIKKPFGLKELVAIVKELIPPPSQYNFGVTTLFPA